MSGEAMKPGEGSDPGPPPAPSTDLDRYLDGLMSADEASRFEATLAGDDALRREVTLQRRIDQGLRARFVPPVRVQAPDFGAPPRTPAESAGGADAIEAMGAETPGVVASIGPRTGARRQRWLGLATAAGLAMALGGGAGYWWFVVGSPAPFRQPAEIWAAQAAASFTPDWVCTTDEEFSSNVRERFGESAVLPLTTPGVQIVGWAYATPVLSNRTATLITRVDGREVLVLIDRAERDVNLRRVGAGGGAGGTPDGLRLFKRRLGGLVLYEVTPLDGPRVIQSFVAEQ